MARGNSRIASEKKRAPRDSPTARKAGIPSETIEAPTIPLDVQQKCLEIFRNALSPTKGDGDVLQEIKGHLFNRDFAAAFGREENLRVYASRWSPSRALGYLQIFEGLTRHTSRALDDADGIQPPARKIVCIGGGAGAELVSIGAWLSTQLSRTSEPRTSAIEVTSLDIAAWDPVMVDLYRSVTIPPPLSQYASTAAKEANHAMLSTGCFRLVFHQCDVFEMDDVALQLHFGEADIVTLMFTLNELYSTSMAKTQLLLARLTKILRSGSLLLVVDSPGSYSTVSINGAEKKYPMQWLLDTTLLGHPMAAGDESVASWEKLESDESRWYRLPLTLQYPIELENMRYQIHLYKRTTDLEQAEHATQGSECG